MKFKGGWERDLEKLGATKERDDIFSCHTASI